MKSSQIKDEVLRLICCPDDGSKVLLKNSFLECVVCKRKFKILGYNFLEILPSKFPAWGLEEDEPKSAEDFYLREFNREFSWNEDTGGWGDLTDAPRLRAFYINEMQRIFELLNPKSNGVAIDVSGGVGNYAVWLSDKVGTMVNCDLHLPSILMANKRKKGNMVCVRTPYLILPFVSSSFDYAICTDTLERGWNMKLSY